MHTVLDTTGRFPVIGCLTAASALDDIVRANQRLEAQVLPKVDRTCSPQTASDRGGDHSGNHHPARDATLELRGFCECLISMDRIVVH